MRFMPAFTGSKSLTANSFVQFELLWQEIHPFLNWHISCHVRQTQRPQSCSWGIVWQSKDNFIVLILAEKFSYNLIIHIGVDTRKPKVSHTYSFCRWHPLVKGHCHIWGEASTAIPLGVWTKTLFHHHPWPHPLPWNRTWMMGSHASIPQFCALVTLGYHHSVCWCWLLVQYDFASPGDWGNIFHSTFGISDDLHDFQTFLCRRTALSISIPHLD